VAERVAAEREKRKNLVFERKKRRRVKKGWEGHKMRRQGRGCG